MLISKENNLQDSMHGRHKTIVKTLEHSPIVYIHICTVVFSLVTEYEMKFVYAGDLYIIFRSLDLTRKSKRVRY